MKRAIAPVAFYKQQPEKKPEKNKGFLSENDL